MWKILSDGSAHNKEAFARLLIKRKVVIYSEPFRGMACLGVFKTTADAKKFIKNIVDEFNSKQKCGGENMTRRELIFELCKRSDLPQKEIERIVEGVFKQITLALERGDKVQIVGFGTFKVKARKAQTVLNPRTGEPMKIPAYKLPTFTAGKTIKTAVNQNKGDGANDHRRN